MDSMQSGPTVEEMAAAIESLQPLTEQGYVLEAKGWCVLVWAPAQSSGQGRRYRGSACRYAAVVDVLSSEDPCRLMTGLFS